jgi:hypothetical protein
MRIAYLSFRHFSRLPAFTCIAFHASNKCLLPIFFPSLFSPFPPLHIYSLPVSNKCLLLNFLSVTFLALLALFPPIFTTYLNLAGNYLINAYIHLSFRHFLTLLTLFPPFFPYHLKPALPASNKCILLIFLSVTFPRLFAPFRALFSVVFNCILP